MNSEQRKMKKAYSYINKEGLKTRNLSAMGEVRRSNE